MPKSKAANTNGDITFFIIAIPIINAFNYYLTYRKISFGLHTLVTYLIDTALGYAAWWLIRVIIATLTINIT